MNSALRFHITTSLKNMSKRTLKRPLKAIGISITVLYFVFMPFLLKETLNQVGFANPQGFVLIITAMNLYIMMPATLSYFKRNGVVFRKQDVNFLFASPISPKQILFYALFKQAFMSLVIQIIGFVAAVFVFRISVLTALIYSVSSLIFSSLMSYSLAIIMYGSERLSERMKQNIKRCVYGVMVLISVAIVLYFIQVGVSIESALALVNHPLILSVPIFGWELGWLNLIILGTSPLTLITGSLFIVSALVLGYLAYKMDCSGDYYEDALRFSERQAKLESKKGNVSVHEMFGKKRKIHQYKGVIKGSYAQTIFSRQLIERRRVRRYFISLGDLLSLIVGIVAGVLSLNSSLDGSMFFVSACGISLYLAIFFNPAPTWKDEFNLYFLYVIPDSMMNKLWYATLMEHLISLIRAVLLAVPFGLIVKASLSDIVLVIIAQVLLKAMIVYKSIFIDGYIGAKIGTNMAQFISMMVSVLLVIIPMIAVVLSIETSSFISFAILSGYSLVMGALFMFFCNKTLTNIESLRD